MESPGAVQSLVDPLAEYNNSPVEQDKGQIYMSLYVHQLPRLERAGLVTVDEETDLVHLTHHGKAVAEALQQWISAR